MKEKGLPGLGQMVFWYPQSDTTCKPLPAIVTAVAMDSISLAIIEAARLNFTVRLNVRHVSDPRTKLPDQIDDGGWDWTPEHQEAMRTKDIIDRLSARLKS